jgi:hypothetical protein
METGIKAEAMGGRQQIVCGHEYEAQQRNDRGQRNQYPSQGMHTYCDGSTLRQVVCAVVKSCYRVRESALKDFSKRALSASESAMYSSP